MELLIFFVYPRLWLQCEINAACGHFLFPVQTQEREIRGSLKYCLMDLYSTPVSSNRVYLSVSHLQPNFPMLGCQFVVCYVFYEPGV
jgi:hypothetical protein